MRTPSSWMCSSERQSKFWLPRYASFPSTTKYFAWRMPPTPLKRSKTRSSRPGIFFSRSTVSGYLGTNAVSTRKRIFTPRSAAASSASTTVCSRLPS